MHRTVRPLAVALLVGAVPASAAIPAHASPTAIRAEFTTCAQLNKVHPHGVGKRGAKDKITSTAKRKPKPVRNFRVDPKLYASLPGSMDRDHDGIACEK